MLNIIEFKGRKWCSAIELHSKLYNNRRYSNFTATHITGYELITEGNEFVTRGLQTSGSKGGRPVTEYLVSLEYAKELCATIRTEQGRLYLKYLINLETQKDAGDLLNHDQIVYLSQLKSVFSYIDNCSEAEKKHRDAYISELTKGSKNPYAAFHAMRNKILDLDQDVIDKRIKEWCIENSRLEVPKTKREALSILDKYEILRNGVWDYLRAQNTDKAMKLANLVKRMAEAEAMQLYRTNEDNLFQTKQELPINIVTKLISK